MHSKIPLKIFKISSGAIDVAEENLEDLVRICSSKLKQPLNDISDPNMTQQQKEQTDIFNQLVEIQQKSLSDVIKELIRQVIFG